MIIKRMTRIILILCIALYLPLCFAGCGRNLTEPKAPAVADGSYTLLIYMCGGSLETKNGAASADLTELLSAAIGKNINVAIETGGASAWKTHGISNENIERFVVSDGLIRRVYTSKPANMGEPDTLAGFLSWGAKAYPAEKTSLILWGHGTAEGVCADELFGGDTLTPEELKRALRDSGIEKLDFIGFDACFSATLDNLDAVAAYAGSMIASQAAAPTSGWDYKALSEKLGKSNISDAILKDYAAANKDANSWALSRIELSRISEIKDIFHELLTSMEKTGVAPFSEIGDLSVANTENMRLYDLGLTSERYGVSTELRDIVNVAYSADCTGASGISFCVPSGDEAAIKSYIKSSTDEAYCSFLMNCLNTAPDDGGIVFTDMGSADGNSLEFALSQGSSAYVKSTAAEVRLADETSLGRISVSDSNGKYTIPLDGKWVSIGGHPLHTDIISEKNGAALLSAAAEVNKNNVRLFLLFNTASQAIELCGYEDENGAVVPLKSEDELAVGGESLSEFAAEYAVLPDGRYSYTGQVTDKKGGVFTTRRAVIDIRNGQTSLVSVSE